MSDLEDGMADWKKCSSCGAPVSEDSFPIRHYEHPGKVFCRYTCSKNFTTGHTPEQDSVNSPNHYTSHKSGIECIQITEHMSFTLGNAIKYIWRADLKNGSEDLKKAIWYLNRELEKRKDV